MDRSGVVYLWIIVMFLSTVWTLILTAPIHCRGSIGEQMTKSYISPNLFWWRNKFIYILDGLRGNTFSTTFWWTIPLKWMNVFLQLPSLFLFCSFFLHPGNALPPSDQGRTLSDGADKKPFSSSAETLICSGVRSGPCAVKQSRMQMHAVNRNMR